MATRDWSQMKWDPTQSFLPPTESQLARSSAADAGQFAEFKFAPTAQNLALLQSLGYGGQGFYDAGPDFGFGSAPGWNDDARNWLSQNGYSLGVAHEEGTTPGGRPEYFGLLGPGGNFVQGQSDPTVTMSDTLMDQITPFLMMAGPFLGAAGVIGGGASAGTSMAGLAADGVSLGSSGIGGASAASGAGIGGAAAGAMDYGSLFQAMPGYATETAPGLIGSASGLAPTGAAINYAPIFNAMPEYMGSAGAALGAGSSEAAGGGGNSLVQSNNNSFLDKVKSGALKGGAKGGITSAVKGENPLKGAAMGALSGAIGGGISSVGDGSLGNAMSLDNSSGGMGLIQGGFDSAPTDTSGILANVGSFGGAANTGGNMNWTDLFSGLSGGGSSNSSDMTSDQLWEQATQQALENSGNYYTQSPWGQQAIDAGNVAGVGSIGDSGGSWDWNSILNGVKSGVGAISGAVGGGGNLAALIGAGLGAASGGGSQTQSRDPWSAAQPYLKNLLGDADAMRANLAQNPFTQQQQQAYQNAYGGLDQARAAMPGLLNWGQQAMQRQSTTPSYEQLFGGGQPMQQQPAPTGGLLNQQGPTMQAGGPGGLLGGVNDDRIKNLMAKGRSLMG
jgi:hypothetical protein